MISALGVSFTGKVLDFGCSDGYVIHSISGIERIGVDLFPIPKYDDVQYVKFNGDGLPFKKNYFDYILCLEVLQYVSDDFKVVKELLRVLKPGGKLVVCVPHKDISFFPFFLNKLLFRLWGDYVRTGYTEPDINKLFDRRIIGEVTVKNQIFFRTFYLLLRLIWLLNNRLGRMCVNVVFKLDLQFWKNGKGYIYFVGKN